MKFITVERAGGEKEVNKIKRNYKVSTTKPEKSIDELSLQYVKVSFFFLLLGILAFVAKENWPDYGQLYSPVLLWGFAAMFIYGMSYLILPDVHHKTVYSRRLLIGQLWIHTLGVLLLVVGVAGSINAEAAIFGQLASWSVYITGVGVLMFLYNMFKSL